MVKVTVAKVSRDEALHFTMFIPATKLTAEDKVLIKKLFKIEQNSWGDSDTLTVHDTINVEYWGESAKHIQLMVNLFDKSKISGVTTKELHHGISLIQDLLIKLETLEKKLGAPNEKD